MIDVADHASGQNICIGAARPGQVIAVSGGTRLTTLEIVVSWLAADDSGAKLLAANAFACGGRIFGRVG